MADLQSLTEVLTSSTLAMFQRGDNHAHRPSPPVRWVFFF